MQIVNAGSAVTLQANVYDVQPSPRLPLNPDTIVVSVWGPTGVALVGSTPMVYSGFQGQFTYLYQTTFASLNGAYSVSYNAQYGAGGYVTEPTVAFVVRNGEGAQGVAPMPPDSSSGITYGRTAYTLNSTDNVGFLSITGGIVAGRRIKAVTTHQAIAFGTSRSLTTVSIGRLTQEHEWGTGIAIALGTENTYLFSDDSQPIADVNYDIIVTADSGLFDSVGQLKVSVHWETYTPSLT